MPNSRILESRQLIIDIYKSFRDELLRGYGQINFELKSDKSVVTELDKKIEQTIREELAEKFPEFGFRGEETGYDTSTSTYWIVDPIDGTGGFVRGIPNCTNMAAFVENGETIVAIIYDFINDQLYHAIKGEGAWCNDKRIHVSSETTKIGINVYGTKIFSKISSILKRKDVSTYRLIGAAGRDGMYVASGKLEGLLDCSRGINNEHDFAPVFLLVKEAGAEVFSLDDEPYIKDGVYRANFFMGSPEAAKIIREYKDEINQIEP